MGGEKLGRIVVAQVSRARHDALLQIIGIRPLLQHLPVVIGFEHKAVSLLQIGRHTVGNVPQVGGKDKTTAADLDAIADIVGTVVRHLEGGNGEVAYHERGLFENGTTHGIDFLRHGIAAVHAVENSLRRIDGNAALLAHITRPPDVVGMVVGDAHRDNRLEGDAVDRQRLLYLPRRNARIDENAVSVGSQIITVSAATARQAQKSYRHVSSPKANLVRLENGTLLFPTGNSYLRCLLHTSGANRTRESFKQERHLYNKNIQGVLGNTGL